MADTERLVAKGPRGEACFIWAWGAPTTPQSSDVVGGRGHRPSASYRRAPRHDRQPGGVRDTRPVAPVHAQAALIQATYVGGIPCALPPGCSDRIVEAGSSLPGNISLTDCCRAPSSPSRPAGSDPLPTFATRSSKPQSCRITTCIA